MLQILSAIFGFAAPFLPEIIKFFREKEDRLHELELIKLRLQAGAQEHLWRMEEVNAKADFAEMQTLRTPTQSFGVQLLDAAAPYTGEKWGKILLSPVFYLFAILDFLSGMVRPTITYAIVGFYMMVKWAQYEVAKMDSTNIDAILAIWGEQDWSVLVLVISYWFGARTAKSVFGGSASSAGKNGY